MKKIAIWANCSKPGAPQVLRRAVDKAAALGLRTYTWGDTACTERATSRLGSKRGLAAIDALMVIGGDGTMLRAVRELGGRDTPVIGVNIGGLGFLTSVAEADLDRALECLAADRFTVSRRAMLDCALTRGRKQLGRSRALNDIVVNSGASARISTLKVSVDGDEVTSLMADGLIVATPTGSTGHSLAAGGPILSPSSPTFVLSSICAHSLGVRPLVIPDTSVVTVEVARCSDTMLLTADGQPGQPLAAGDRIEARKSAQGATFIHLPGFSYFAVLRQKLHWRGSSV